VDVSVKIKEREEKSRKGEERNMNNAQKAGGGVVGQAPISHRPLVGLTRDSITSQLKAAAGPFTDTPVKHLCR